MATNKTVRFNVLMGSAAQAKSGLDELAGRLDTIKKGANINLTLKDGPQLRKNLDDISLRVKELSDKGANIHVRLEGAAKTQKDMDALALETRKLNEAGAGVSTTMTRVGKDAESMGSRLTGVLNKVGPMLWGGIAVAAGLAIKQSADYQSQLTLLVTGAGESESKLNMVGSGIKSIALNTGETLSQLTSGAFMIESAGFHGAAGLKVLSAAAEEAKVGGADLGTVGDALTTVMKDFNLSANHATNAASGLNAIVSNGKVHLEDLASSMSRVLPTAAALRISFGDVGGAMATLTGEGVSARMAAMGINSAILALAAPSAKASGEMDVLGMGEKKAAKYANLMASGHKKAAAALVGIGGTSKMVADTLTKHGLVAAMKIVADLALNAGPRGSAAYVAALKDMVGGNRGLQVALGLTGDHLSTTLANVKSVSKAYSGAGTNVTGWARTQDDFNVKMDRFKETLQVASVTVGTALIPALSGVVTVLLKLSQNKMLLLGLASAIGVIAVAWVAVKVQATYAAIAENMNPVIAILAVLVIALLYVATHWKQVKQWAMDAVTAIHAAWAAFCNYLHSSWSATANWFSGAWQTFLNFWKRIGAAISKAFGDVCQAFADAWRATAGWFSQQWNDFINKWKNVGRTLKDAFNDVCAGLSTAWRNTASWFSQRWSDFVNNWKAIGRAIASIFKNDVMTPITNGWSWFARWVGNLWAGISSTASRIWNDVKNDVTTPIRWVVNNIWNPFAGVIDKVASFVGIGLSLQVPHMATGGVVPGNPGIGDWQPVYATPGERILSLNQVAQLGGHAALDSYFGMGSSGPHYAGGGTVPGPAGTLPTGGSGMPGGLGEYEKWLSSHPMNWGALNPLNWAKKLEQGAIEIVVKPLVDSLLGGLSHLPGGSTPLGKILTKVPETLFNKFLGWVAGEDSAANAAGGSGSTGMLNFMLSKLGHPYSETAGRFGPNFYDCSGLVWAAAHSAGIPLPQGEAIANLEAEWFSRYDHDSVINGLGQVKRGDLLFMRGASPDPSPWGGIGHTGMALSNNQMVSAYDTSMGVAKTGIGGFVVGVRLGSSGSQIGGATGSQMQNGRELYSYLLRNLFGGDKIAAAGAIASIWGESGWNPFAEGSGGRGLIQWTPPGTISDAAYSGGMRTQEPAIIQFVATGNTGFAIANMMSANSVLSAANIWGRGVERFGINDVHPEGVSLATSIMNTTADMGALIHPGYTLVHNGLSMPEVISPQSGPFAARGGGDTYIINVNCHPSNNPDETARQIQQMLRVYKVHLGNQPLGLS